jgi:hypothetical protein
MRTPVRMSVMKLIACFVILFWVSGAVEAAPQANVTDKPSHATPVATPLSGLLDVVLQGPFVVERTSSDISVLVPNVPNHSAPLLEGASPLNSRILDAGEYTLTISNPGSGATNIVNPVAGTSLLNVAGKTEHLSSDPSKLRYLRLTLPLPLEVVPWNADPMWISNITPIPPNTGAVRLAVLVVLRYQFSPSTTIRLTGHEDDGTPISDTLTSLSSGNEHFIFLVQGMTQDDVSDHPTALASFEKMKQLEPPLSRYLDIPDLGGVNPGRNQPLLPNVEPKDLTDFLLSNASVNVPLVAPNGKRGLVSSNELHLLIAHSDCKAAIIYVDYTK